jgi:probable F420-dependent oxidoreductase
MLIGTTIRNMGSESTAQLMMACARAAESRSIESIWITDHIAIPPDDAEGSGGRYLDTLTTLAWLAGVTSTIKLGSGVLIVPYRAKLPTAKQIATVAELSDNRLLLGVGVGWMDPEFRALGVDRHQRGRITDATLAFLNQCFANDVVTLNGQEFLFKPRPPKPPVLVGGAAPHALQRAAQYADGWLPMANNPHKLAEPIEQYRKLTDQLNRPAGNVTVMTTLPLHDPETTRRTLAAYRHLNVDRLVCALRYTNIEEYERELDKLNTLIT